MVCDGYMDKDKDYQFIGCPESGIKDGQELY